jgi:hypothetical protein
MEKLLERKGTVLVLAVLALLSLVLLTNALSSMDFLPSQPIGGGHAEQINHQAVNLELILKTAAEVALWKQLTFWGIWFLALLIFTSLLSPELRRKILRAFLRTAIFALLLLYLIKKQPDLFASFLGRFSGLNQDLALNPETNSSATPVFEPPQDVSWLSFAVTLGIILLAGLLIWWAGRLWTQLREAHVSRDSLNQIAAIARESLGELKAGRSYENAIIECYDRMSDVLVRRQGLKRGHTMTPSEFAADLMRAGLPRDPIQKLTGLFEAVRYGSRPAGQHEIDQAIDALTAILLYCGEAAS